MNYVYELRNLDIVMAAGGPMGSPVKLRWSKLFSKLDTAKSYASHRTPVEWKHNSTSQWSSQDLGDTQFVIIRRRVEA
jgi:hypothetical protein